MTKPFGIKGWDVRIELETKDIEAIAGRVVELLAPYLQDRKEKRSEDEIMDLKGLCPYLHVSAQWVYQRTHCQEIPFYKLDGKLLFRKSEIDAWLLQSRSPEVSKGRPVLKSMR